MEPRSPCRSFFFRVWSTVVWQADSRHSSGCAGIGVFEGVCRRRSSEPQWIVTSPPYKHAFAMLRQALVVARVGVIFKLRLFFLEPTKSSASPCNLSRKEMQCPGGMDYVALWRNSSQPPCSAGCICCVIVPGRGGTNLERTGRQFIFSP